MKLKEENGLPNYKESKNDLLNRLNTTMETGLTTDQANERIAKFGENKLNERNINGRNVDPNQRIICYIPDRVKDRDMLLYSGLPTTIKINVPLIIDAPFELTTSREILLHNKWNEFIRGHMYKAILNIMDLKKI